MVMSYGAAGSGGAVAAYMVMQSNAIKACGGLVKVEPEKFQEIVYKVEDGLVIFGKAGFFKSKFRYLIGYKGLVFHTVSEVELEFGDNVELMLAKKISMPDI